MREFYFDIETFSALDLTRVGSYLYARHASTDVRCVSYCLVTDGVRGPIETWRPGEPVPQAAFILAEDPDARAIAFNNAFDRQIYEQILTPRYAWPSISFERHWCAQASVLARALPASLDAVAAALNITTRKSKEGIAVMKRLAGPRRQSAKERKAGAPLDFSATPEELATLAEYNRIDVLMMMEIVDRIGLLTPDEQTRWQLDQRINERGAHLDIHLLEAGLCISQEAQRETQNQIAELTGGEVTTTAQRDRIIKWLTNHGCQIPNLQKGTVADVLLEPGLAKPARQLLQLRQSGAGAAVHKFATLRRWAGDQDEPRVRYAYRFHGGSAGRFTSLGVQLQNLRKSELVDVQSAIDAVGTGSLAEMRRRGFERPLEVIGQITRAVFTAPLGKQLYIADLSGIEARGAAFVCKALTELEQWRTFDHTGRPEDEPYYQTGIKTFAQPATAARKAGKTGALAFQYGGGVRAYRKVTGDYETADEVILGRHDAWRRDHPMYTEFWRLALFQAVQAISHPGQEFSAKVVAFQYNLKTGFLEVMLPSGRRLTYPKAELFEDEQHDTTSFTFLDASGSQTGRMYHERKGSGVFGGLLLENITQALCRDVFIETMPRLEAAGYPLVMHTHDDFVCEAPAGFGSLDEFLALITAPPSWAPELPVAAKGRISNRFIEIRESKPEAVNVAADNAIDNTLVEDDEEDESDDDKTGEPTPTTPKPNPQSEPPHVCLHCRRDPPDGLERASAYDGAWLHPQCEEPFLRVRMQGEGIPREPPPPPEPTPTPPPPLAGNGRAASDGFDLEQLLRSARGAGNKTGEGYPRGENAGPSAGPAAAEYIYKNAAGRLHMRVVRTTGKSFPTYHWGGGEWILGWPKEVVPYHLPELLAANPETVVLICEGEKDTDTAARYGFVATTNPGGAGKWQPELTQYFQGKQRIVLMQDNDAAGRKHTALVARQLKDVVPNIGVAPFPELPENGDLTDFFERGGTKQALEIRIAEALAKGAAKTYKLRTMSAVKPQRYRWLWPDYLARGHLELLAGEPELGKSQIQCQYIACTTTTKPWPDGTPNINEPGRVLMLTAEDQIDDTVWPRLKAAGADLDLVEHLDWIKRNDRDELFLLREDLDKLALILEDYPDIVLITIDPITAYMGSGKGFDSHRATDVRSQLAPLKDLAGHFGVALSAVTHPPKNAGHNPLNMFIGSQAYIAAARIGHLCLAKYEDGDYGARRKTGKVWLTTPKFSLGAKGDARTLSYQIATRLVDDPAGDAEPFRTSAIEWLGVVDLTPEEAIAQARASAKGDSNPVHGFLHGILANGPVLQKVVVEQGAAHSYSVKQLRRARKVIGAVAFKRRGEKLDSPWMWALPEHIPATDIEREEEEE
jgi:DNA polymerase